MANTPVNRERARTYTRAAQLAVVVLAASAVALAALDVRAPAPEAPPSPEGPTGPSATTNPTDSQLPPLDVEDIAFRLAGPEAPPVPGPAEAGVVTPADPGPAVVPSGPDLRYLGAIIEPTRRVALIAVDGRQRLLAEGREFRGVRIVSVDQDAVVVVMDGIERRIPKSERSGSLLTQRAPAPPPNTSVVMQNGVTAAQTMNLEQIRARENAGMREKLLRDQRERRDMQRRGSIYDENPPPPAPMTDQEVEAAGGDTGEQH